MTMAPVDTGSITFDDIILEQDKFCDCDQFEDVPCQNRVVGDEDLCQECKPRCIVSMVLRIECCGYGTRCQLVPLLDGSGMVHARKG